MAIWHNGELKNAAWMDASSAGVMLGWGVFTTLGIQNGRALWIEKHLARLKRDAAKCDIEIRFSDELLRDGLNAVLREDGVRNGLARLTATRRDDGRWNTQTGNDLSIVALETAPPTMRDLRVGFASAPSMGELSGVKTTSYLPYFWSWREAQKQGWDEVILLEGNVVVEAARSSVFWVRGGQLETAPLSSGALQGIGREIVLEWAKANGVEARQNGIDAAELKACDEVFLVSAATGPRAVRVVCRANGEWVLPDKAPVFEALRAWWDSQ